MVGCVDGAGLLPFFSFFNLLLDIYVIIYFILTLLYCNYHCTTFSFCFTFLPPRKKRGRSAYETTDFWAWACILFIVLFLPFPIWPFSHLTIFPFDHFPIFPFYPDSFTSWLPLFYWKKKKIAPPPLSTSVAFVCCSLLDPRPDPPSWPYHLFFGSTVSFESQDHDFIVNYCMKINIPSY